MSLAAREFKRGFSALDGSGCGCPIPQIQDGLHPLSGQMHSLAPARIRARSSLGSCRPVPAGRRAFPAESASAGTTTVAILPRGLGSYQHRSDPAPRTFLSPPVFARDLPMDSSCEAE